MKKRILLTGAAGFIGANLVKAIYRRIDGVEVIGVDSLNDYYDVRLKRERLRWLEGLEGFTFIQGNISDRTTIEQIFEEYRPQIVINLAAQAGVRYSLENPEMSIEANIIGFYNILEACRRYPVEHLLFASSSSVYGTNQKYPYTTEDKCDTPVSLYAATKKSNEVMAHAYSKLFGIPTTGVRFFTVYGPAGRPDMAYYQFTERLLAGEKIQIFNYGECKRDFTYIDDVVEGLVRIVENPPKGEIPYILYNIGNSHPENLLDFVNILQEELVRAGLLPENYDFESQRELLPMQPGDVTCTCADVTPLEKEFGYKPSTPLREGLRKFVEWYREYKEYKQDEKTGIISHQIQR